MRRKNSLRIVCVSAKGKSSFVRRYENGGAEVSWMLQPDGRYDQDEDGFVVDDEGPCS